MCIEDKGTKVYGRHFEVRKAEMEGDEDLERMYFLRLFRDTFLLVVLMSLVARGYYGQSSV